MSSMPGLLRPLPSRAVLRRGCSVFRAGPSTWVPHSSSPATSLGSRLGPRAPAPLAVTRSAILPETLPAVSSLPSNRSSTPGPFLNFRRSNLFGSVPGFKGSEFLQGNKNKNSVNEHRGSAQEAKAAEDGAAGSAGLPDLAENLPCKFIWPDGTRRPRVCILGGGFGGLYTALKLDSLLWTPERRPQVVLVDQSDRFVFKPLLYELLTREVSVWEIAPFFRDLLQPTKVIFLQDSVAAVDPTDRQPTPGAPSHPSGTPTGSQGAPTWGPGSTQSAPAGSITLESGSVVEYDWLVLALGAETRMAFVPGAKGLALPFATLKDALKVDATLTELERAQFGVRERIRVLVVGAGYSGVELACVVAERLGDRGSIEIVDPSPIICRSAPAANRDAALAALQEKAVGLRLGEKVTSMCASDAPDSGLTTPLSSPVQVSFGAVSSGAPPVEGSTSSLSAEFDLVLWTVGTTPVVPRYASGVPESGNTPFPVTGRGQAEVEGTLRVRDHPRVFALGDSAAFVPPTSEGVTTLLPGATNPLPGTAQLAFQEADYVAWNIWSSINARPLLPFRYQHLGEMLTLGSGQGAVSIGFLDDFFLGGRLAHTARKVAYLYRMPTLAHQAKVGASWLTKAAVDTVALAQNALSAFVRNAK